MPTIMQAQAKFISQEIYPPLQKHICHYLLTGFMAFSFVLLLGTQNISIAASTDSKALLLAENTTAAKLNLQELQEKAEQGDASAQTKLGGMYYFGLGIPQDNKKAAYYYKRAAKQDDADAQAMLGIMYTLGEGVEQNDKKAANYHELAAKQGHHDAQIIIGTMYKRGEGVEQDYKKAVYYYTLAVKQGSATAQLNLGIMYANAMGVPQDYTKARHYYELAAKQGHANAQILLGSIYYDGQAVPQNYKKALHYYELAAKQGYAAAQSILGKLYFLGQGKEVHGNLCKKVEQTKAFQPVTRSLATHQYTKQSTALVLANSYHHSSRAARGPNPCFEISCSVSFCLFKGSPRKRGGEGVKGEIV